jgi:hypothetical protein
VCGAGGRPPLDQQGVRVERGQPTASRQAAMHGGEGALAGEAVGDGQHTGRWQAWPAACLAGHKRGCGGGAEQ